MGTVNINMDGALITAQETFAIHTRVSGSGDGNISVSAQNAEIIGRNISMINDIQTNSIYADMAAEVKKMNRQSPEYAALQKLISESAKDNTAEKKRKVKEHIASFAEGVLAGIVKKLCSEWFV